MAGTDPWITLGRKRDDTFKNVTLPLNETYAALANGKIVGVIIVAMPIPLIKGYIPGLAVDHAWRNRGIGAKLLRFAEERTSPANRRTSSSAFHRSTPMRSAFYKRMGYERIGELKDYMIPGASEILMRKTTGAWSTFRPSPAASE